ncbi:hypothetical protein [Streptomyces sp. NPDC004376]
MRLEDPVFSPGYAEDRDFAEFDVLVEQLGRVFLVQYEGRSLHLPR